MRTIEEVLTIMDTRVDRAMLENYIAREWVRPQPGHQDWYFEEIDVARVQLVNHLVEDIQLNDQGVDVALLLLDQLYGLRAQMRYLTHAITQQPSEVQAEIKLTISQSMSQPNRS